MAIHRFVIGVPCIMGIAVLAAGSCQNGGPSEPVLRSGNGGAGASNPLAGSGGASPSNDGGMVYDGDITDGTALVPFEKAALIRSSGECALSSYQRFEVAMAVASEKANLYAAALTEASLNEARLAWRAAMGAWQQTELSHFGPAARSPSPGGQGLRDQIYSFPPAARCQVDVQLVNQAYKGIDFAQTFINGRGLGALEYLLWNTSSANRCLPGHAINEKGTWAAVPAVELTRRRADYAAVVGKDILTRARTLIAAWNGGFQQQLLSAGTGSALFASEQAALNTISDAIFYLDELKDEKLGLPLECISPSGTCPEALESTFARESTANIVNNLLGARNALIGCGAGGEGLGFDDWLGFIGQGDLALTLTQDLNAALQLARSLDPPLEDAIVSSPEKVRALRDAIRKVTTFLKGQFSSLLNLDRPMTVDGDND